MPSDQGQGGLSRRRPRPRDAQDHNASRAIFLSAGDDLARVRLAPPQREDRKQGGRAAAAVRHSSASMEWFADVNASRSHSRGCGEEFPSAARGLATIVYLVLRCEMRVTAALFLP
jgi:hypothetical protein